MKSHRRVLAVIDLNGHGARVAAEAGRVATAERAAIAIAHVIDYGRGLDVDHVPLLTPGEAEARLRAEVDRRLGEMAVKAGVPAAIRLVASGNPDHELRALALAWQPDLIMVGERAPHGLSSGGTFLAANGFSRVRADVVVIPSRQGQTFLEDVQDFLRGAARPVPAGRSG